jgi:hypothetical protein
MQLVITVLPVVEYRLSQLIREAAKEHLNYDKNPQRRAHFLYS